jgi:hypothetical protein
LLPAIVARLGDPQVYLEVQEYMNDSLSLNPTLLFSHLHTMLSNEQIRLHLLFFIEENLTQFIKTADLKAYLPALFHGMTINGDTAIKSERLLDAIIESQGKAFLDKSVH